jgi:hypothetical protein
MTQKAHVAALAVAAILLMPAHAATQHPASPGQPDIHDAALKGDLQAVKVLLARDPALGTRFGGRDVYDLYDAPSCRHRRSRHHRRSRRRGRLGCAWADRRRP